jgi:hypothetical protein
MDGLISSTLGGTAPGTGRHARIMHLDKLFFACIAGQLYGILAKA